MDPEGQLQTKPELIPANFCFKIGIDGNPTANIDSSIVNKQFKQSLRSKEIFELEFKRTLSKYLNEIKESVSKTGSGVWTDKIETESKKLDNKKRKQQDVEEETISQDLVQLEVIGEWTEKDATIIKMSRQEYYGRIPHSHRTPITPIIADPIYRNPNSFESMIEIFREMKKKNPLRKWFAVVMDGVPYVLGLKVIAWSMICEECGECVFKDAGRTKHIKARHEKAQKAPTFKLEFGNLLLIPGGGHIFMNVSYQSS